MVQVPVLMMDYSAMEMITAYSAIWTLMESLAMMAQVDLLIIM